MIELIFLLFGAAFLVGGVWQIRHPERTQDLALRYCRGRLLRRFYSSDDYFGAIYLNGVFFTIIGAAALLFAVASFAMSVVWPGPN